MHISVINKKLWYMLIIFVLQFCLLSFLAGNTLVANAEAETSSDVCNTPDYVYTDENGEPYALKDNVIYETDDIDHTQYNCYAYVTGAYDPEDANAVLQEYMREPGFEIDVQYNPNWSTGYTANIIKADLEAMGYANVIVSTAMPTTITDNTRIIAFRKGAYDFHCMIYNQFSDVADGIGWYHKPGTSLVLKFTNTNKLNADNSFKADSIWLSEGYCNAPYRAMHINDDGTQVDIVYDSEIYYISFTTVYNFISRVNEVRSYADMDKIREHNDEKWVFMNDIYIPSNTTWTPIPNTTIDCIIDGNGHIVSGLKIVSSYIQDTGFIIDNHAEIKNLTFRNVTINLNGSVNFDTTINIGVIAAKSCDNCIANCTVGNARIYGEAKIYSNINANIGAICGTLQSPINNCHVNYFGTSGFGRIGGIAGYAINNIITSCSVNNSNISIFHGEAGGILGYSNNNDIDNCIVTNTILSCYNGFPDGMPQYYPDNHFARVGGIVGCEIRTTTNNIKNCTISYSTIMCNSAEIGATEEGKKLAPEMGIICGRANTDVGTIESCNNIDTTVDIGNLKTVTWKYGFLNLLTGSWNQAQYAGQRDIGRTAAL